MMKTEEMHMNMQLKKISFKLKYFMQGNPRIGERVQKAK